MLRICNSHSEQLALINKICFSLSDRTHVADIVYFQSFLGDFNARNDQLSEIIPYYRIGRGHHDQPSHQLRPCHVHM